MKITGLRTFLVDAAPPGRGGWERRNFLFVKILTDAGVYGVGEGSGWPRVVQAAVEDLSVLLVGEDPFDIERLWMKMFSAIVGHGMTGVVGGGALTAVEMALWDLKGRALGRPVWDLLGGKVRDAVPVYTHAGTVEQARVRVDRGFTALKTGGVKNCVETVDAIRREVGPDVDLMVDVHGPPWMTTADAIALGRALEGYGLLFYEDPVAPENLDGLAEVAGSVRIPIAAGERHAFVFGVREMIERGIVDVIQPDTGRFGGLVQMRKAAALAEAHFVTVAPHDGSLGPVAEMAAVHFLATIPNCLVLEHLEDDVPQRYEVMTGGPSIRDSAIAVPDAPGLGVDLVEEAIRRYPSTGNVSPPDPSSGYRHVAARRGRSRWLSTDPTERPDYLPGSIF